MLKISARGEYALLLIRLLRTTGTRLTLHTAAEKLWVSEWFLRKIANTLEKEGYIRSFAGRHGGVEVAPESVSVYDILRAVGEDLSLTACTGNHPCEISENCGISDIFKQLQRWIDSLLKLNRL